MPATKKQKRVGFIAGILAMLATVGGGGVAVQSQFAHTSRGHGTTTVPTTGGTTTTVGATTTTIPTGGSVPLTPAATGAQICGNSSVLDGPTTAPSGSTVVSASVLGNYGTTAGSSATRHVYYLTAGVHTLSDPATPIYSGTGTLTKNSRQITNLVPDLPAAGGGANQLPIDGGATVSGVSGGSFTTGSGQVFVGARVNERTSATSMKVATSPNASKTGATIKIYSTYPQITAANYVTITGAPGAILDGLGSNASAITESFGTTANHVIIEHLTIRNFAPGFDEGGINPGGAGHDWTVRYSTLSGFGGASVMLGTKAKLEQNCITSNSQYGFSAYEAVGGDLGPSGIVVNKNEITNNDLDRVENRPNCDGSNTIVPCANGNFGGAKLWQTVDTTVSSNYIHDNYFTGIWFDSDNVGAQFISNYVKGQTGIGFWYEVSYNAVIAYNNFIENDLIKGPGNPFPGEGAVYISESGGESRYLAGSRGNRGYTTIEINNNRFENNWSGLALWESPDRFCGNGETQFCTLVNSNIPNTSGGGPCFSRTAVQVSPYPNDCRWKTQNVHVHDNTFLHTASAVNAAVVAKGGASGACTGAVYCGVIGLFSTFGTYPCYNPFGNPGARSPDTCINNGDPAGPTNDNGKTQGSSGYTISDRIAGTGAVAGTQGNLFTNNTYTGAWKFIAHDTGNFVSFATWKLPPGSPPGYGQDATGSTCC